MYGGEVNYAMENTGSIYNATIVIVIATRQQEAVCIR